MERRGGSDYRLNRLALPLGWEWQGVLFAALTRWRLPLWWRWLARRVRGNSDLSAVSNQRGQQLVGRRFMLDAALVNGRSGVSASSWPRAGFSHLAAQVRMSAIAVEGITLRIRAV